LDETFKAKIFEEKMSSKDAHLMRRTGSIRVHTSPGGVNSMGNSFGWGGGKDEEKTGEMTASGHHKPALKADFVETRIGAGVAGDENKLVTNAAVLTMWHLPDAARRREHSSATHPATLPGRVSKKANLLEAGQRPSRDGVSGLRDTGDPAKKIIESSASDVSVHMLMKELCSLILAPATRAGAVDARTLRKATATAYDCLLFWDGGEEYEDKQATSRSHGDAHLLGVAAGIYSMRCAGQERDADHLEDLLSWISPSFNLLGAGMACLSEPTASEQPLNTSLKATDQALLKFLPPGVRQRVLKLENVDTILSVLMQLRTSAIEIPQVEEPLNPSLPLRQLGGTQFTCFTGTKVQILTQKALLECGTDAVRPLDRDSSAYTLYKHLAFSSVGGVSNHFLPNAASFPGITPAHQLLLSKPPTGPELCEQTGGRFFSAVTHGLQGAHAAVSETQLPIQAVEVLRCLDMHLNTHAQTGGRFLGAVTHVCIYIYIYI
jgi:hypothetical protein